MQYFATLSLGGVYLLGGKTYNRGEEVSVTKEEYDYLETLVEKKLQTHGNGWIAIEVPRFSFRFVEPTKEEKVLADVATVSDDIGPRKPGRPAKQTEE